MITAVDTNIIIDILLADKKYFADSKAVIDTHNEQGQLIISEVVYAELACQFASEIELKEFLSDTLIKLVISSEKALSLAGERWKGYSKQSMVSDFMIGSHALNHADLLLSRDRGFYKTYFKDIDVKNKI
ncbi:MAG: type II toxin-antitoxin system VapC family toxin [Candidatus Scalindua sp.]